MWALPHILQKKIDDLSSLCGKQKSPRDMGTVPKEGVEPSRDCSHQALNLARLPIPPLRLK
jgi:hypothetical protein